MTVNKALLSGLMAKEELIEVEGDASPVALKPAVKVTAKKAVTEVKTISEADAGETSAVVEESGAGEAAAEETVAEDKQAEKSPPRQAKLPP